jgi:hypothetical protein
MTGAFCRTGEIPLSLIFTGTMGRQLVMQKWKWNKQTPVQIHNLQQRPQGLFRKQQKVIKV